MQRVTSKFDRHVNSLGQLKAGLPMAYVFKYLNTGINPDVEGTRSRRTQAAESDPTSRTRSEPDTSQLKMQLESPLAASDAESGSTYPPPPLDCCVLNSSTSTVLRCVHVYTQIVRVHAVVKRAFCSVLFFQVFSFPFD